MLMVAIELHKVSQWNVYAVLVSIALYLVSFVLLPTYFGLHHPCRQQMSMRLSCKGLLTSFFFSSCRLGFCLDGHVLAQSACDHSCCMRACVYNEDHPEEVQPASAHETSQRIE